MPITVCVYTEKLAPCTVRIYAYLEVLEKLAGVYAFFVGSFLVRKCM